MGQGAVFGRRSVNSSLKVSEPLAVRYVSLRMKNTAPNHDELLIKNQRQSFSSAHVNIDTNDSKRHSQSLFHISPYKIDNMFVHIRTSSAYGRGLEKCQGGRNRQSANQQSRKCIVWHTLNVCAVRSSKFSLAVVNMIHAQSGVTCIGTPLHRALDYIPQSACDVMGMTPECLERLRRWQQQNRRRRRK